MAKLLQAVNVRPMEARDVEAADRVMRLAFGTFLGAPDPMTVFGDADYVRSRFTAEPNWGLVAERNGEIVGSNFLTRWGSFGFFGPLTVRPDLWDGGIASRLLEPIVNVFDRWDLRQAALFTFPQSPKHLHLYHKFGFWPQYLTPVLEKPVLPTVARARIVNFSSLPATQREDGLNSCRQITEAIFEGLDVGHEVRATEAQHLGETILVYGGSELIAFAVCHCGAGEAGSGTCYVKFAAVRPGRNTSARFDNLLDACEALAAERGLGRVVAGINVARHEAYQQLLDRGYRTQLSGIIFQRPNEPGYCRPDVYVLDDLR